MPEQRTLLLSEIFPPTVGGSGRLFYELYSRQPAGRFVVAAGASPGADAFDKTHEIEVHRLPLALGDRGIRSWRGLKYYLGTAKRVRALMRQTGCARLHCARNVPEGFIGYLLNRFHGIPYVFYTHGEDIGVSRFSRELAWMTRRVMSRATAAIGTSFNTRRCLLEDWNYPQGKIHVIQPGMDASRFQVLPMDSDTRLSLGWAGRTVVLTVGRLQARKGHDRLIRALHRVRQAVPNVLYAIVGTGQEEAALKALVLKENLGDVVQFLGGVSDSVMTQCYQQCDLFCLPNRTIVGDIEGFGMVLLEAQACGKPVLAGDSGGTAETMDIPHTGRVVNCDSHELLAEALVDLLSDPVRLQAMGTAARTWVETRFDWPQRATWAAEVWDKIAGVGVPPSGGLQ
jgi:phosphatidyl-myo-inositol dimannoside synthase